MNNSKISKILLVLLGLYFMYRAVSDLKDIEMMQNNPNYMVIALLAMAVFFIGVVFISKSRMKKIGDNIKIFKPYRLVCIVGGFTILSTLLNMLIVVLTTNLIIVIPIFLLLCIVIFFVFAFIIKRSGQIAIRNITIRLISDAFEAYFKKNSINYKISTSEVKNKKKTEFLLDDLKISITTMKNNEAKIVLINIKPFLGKHKAFLTMLDNAVKIAEELREKEEYKEDKQAIKAFYK